jgi:hypothetical protein
MKYVSNRGIIEEDRRTDGCREEEDEAPDDRWTNNE